MTLPFRRRHHDHEGSHDRARAIAGEAFEGQPSGPEAAWLASHLETCGECRAEIDGWRADRELLRGLRATAPEPPRDLWARTSAAIERESGRRDRAARPYGGPRLGRVPLGAASGVLVILVVVATSLLPDQPLTPPTTGDTPRPTNDVAAVTPPPEATPLAVFAKALTWVQQSRDGSYEIVVAPVEEVCTDSPDACAPLDDASATRLSLDAEPEAVVVSDAGDQLVVVTAASDQQAGEVIVVDVPGPTGGPTEPPGSPTPEPTPEDGATPTPVVVPTPTATGGATGSPTATLVPSLEPTGGPGEQGRSILTGVVVVGEPAYSESGEWLAFTARPLDGTSGPDLYTWRVGDAEATRVSSNGRTFFAGWLGDLVLASRVEPAPGVDANASPSPSDGGAATPTAAPTETSKPGRTSKPRTPAPSQAPGETPGPLVSPDPSAAPQEHPVSFLLDPATGGTLELAGQDIWRPVVDPTSRTIVYWRGTLVADESGTGWALGSGELVLDGWIEPSVLPTPSPDPNATPGPGATELPLATATPEPGASADPLASPEATLPPGPAGSPTVLAGDDVTDFDASFDPEGERLAVWLPDAENPGVGTLRLLVLDPETGVVDEDIDPLPGVTALRGFSIDTSRLAWVTPPGQDGAASHVHVLAWKGDDFGQVRSIAIDRLFVAR